MLVSSKFKIKIGLPRKVNMSTETSTKDLSLDYATSGFIEGLQSKIVVFKLVVGIYLLSAFFQDFDQHIGFKIHQPLDPVVV